MRGYVGECTCRDDFDRNDYSATDIKPSIFQNTLGSGEALNGTVTS